ncbi:hypothetical protein [Cerasicoccus maritimus]|uniref:hypothetical protein n=1 Tax=Cerasicoccus maritimus TaxID=490089 RepID=UPI002852BA59|nr:hypothetical protein [Cerasicoccus maritimus]
MIFKRTYLAILFLLPSALVAQITINWGTGISFNRIVQQDGTSIPSPSNGYTYELGTFGSFVPTADNIDEWADNWHAFDGDPFFYTAGATNVGLYLDSAGLDSSQQTTSTYTGADSSYTFAAGQQAYVWIYNENDVDSMDTTTQWALYTQLIDGSSSIDAAWQMPDASSSTTTRSWYVSSADTAVWGSVDSGADTGGGSIYESPTSYHVQTAGFTAGVYWDINGSTAGATNDGGGDAAGTWNSTNTNWSDDPTGNVSTGAYTEYKVATFSANDGGTGEASGDFTVTKAGSSNVFGLDFVDGTVTIGHGTGGEIVFDTDDQLIAFDDGEGNNSMIDTAFINVYSGNTATIETAISSTQDVNLTGGGTLVLAGSQTGEIDGTLALQSGTLELEGTGTNPRLGFNSGGTTNISIEGGSLIVSETTPASDVQFGSTTTVNYSSGYIELNNVNESLGTLSLTLSADSEMNFTGDSTSTIISFADSSGIDWSSSETLLITEWSGNAYNIVTGTGGGGTDQFYIGTDSSGLTADQLSKIKFVNPYGLEPGIYDAYILSTGEIVPGVIPEPSTYAFGGTLLLLGVGDYYRRRKKVAAKTC